MTLDNVWVKDGNATYGAGLFVAGTSNVTIKNSTFSGNIASHGGGAIYIDGANLTIQNSTLSGNTINPGGQAGAAVYIYSGNVSIQNSTISGNSAPAEAGVIYNHRAGYLTIQNSIVANQVNGRDCEGAGNFYENGYNIESGIWCFFTLPSDQQNVSSADLKLQPLASSGAGLTPTIALGSGSVALEKIASGAACGGTYPFDQDQRGKPRPGNKNNPSNNCEIGAWEAQTTDLTLAVALRSLKASFRAGPGRRRRVGWGSPLAQETILRQRLSDRKADRSLIVFSQGEPNRPGVAEDHLSAHLLIIEVRKNLTSRFHLSFLSQKEPVHLALSPWMNGRLNPLIFGPAKMGRIQRGACSLNRQAIDTPLENAYNHPRKRPAWNWGCGRPIQPGADTHLRPA